MTLKIFNWFLCVIGGITGMQPMIMILEKKIDPARVKVFILGIMYLQ